MGNVTGKVFDADKQTPITGASVVLVDAEGRETRSTTDGSGQFRFDGVKPGAVQLKVEAEKYLRNSASAEVKPREDARAEIGLHVRPKQANVVVTKQEIVIKKQIHFETDSAVIKGDSNALLEEIADTIIATPDIKKVEIQGHTDNTGTADRNLKLSDDRANAVKSWLSSHGVDAGRLDAKGYGQTRPLVPNVTAGNRAMNRRVQLKITERAK
jgi:outer membrane protein OmpA-like peptidoglycan-associated protein